MYLAVDWGASLVKEPVAILAQQQPLMSLAVQGLLTAKSGRWAHFFLQLSLSVPLKFSHFGFNDGDKIIVLILVN